MRKGEKVHLLESYISFSTDAKTEAATRDVLQEKVCSARKSCRPKASKFIKKESLAQAFSCEFCENSKNTFFTEHLWATVSAKTHISTAPIRKERLFKKMKKFCFWWLLVWKIKLLSFWIFRCSQKRCFIKKKSVFENVVEFTRKRTCQTGSPYW